MQRPVAALLAELDSREIQAWQAFFTWRAAEEKRRAREREFLKDDDEVITY
jgi:hypothetical protein